MPYLNEAGLAYYDPKLKEWIASQPVKTLPSTLYPWTLTDKAGAVTCWPVGGTQLLPTVDFMFSETGPAEGTKGPDNPSTITGVSSITVTRCETVGVDSTDYTIDLGGTYYGGFVDLSTGVMTVTHKYMDISGDTANLSTNVTYEGTDTSCCYFSPYPGRLMTKDTAVSNRFIINESATSFRNDLEMLYTANGVTTVVFRINKSRLGSSYDATDAAAIKSAWVEWFSNNPTCIVYQLAAPQIVQISTTEILSLAQTDKYVPRINTVYTDAQAVQVGYVKSPIREEYELQQAIVGQGGNI